MTNRKSILAHQNFSKSVSGKIQHLLARMCFHAIRKAYMACNFNCLSQAEGLHKAIG